MKNTYYIICSSTLKKNDIQRVQMRQGIYLFSSKMEEKIRNERKKIISTCLVFFLRNKKKHSERQIKIMETKKDNGEVNKKYLNK